MKRFVLLLGVLIAGGCNDDPAAPVTRDFLEGTVSNPQIGLVVNSTGKATLLAGSLTEVWAATGVASAAAAMSVSTERMSGPG